MNCTAAGFKYTSWVRPLEPACGAWQDTALHLEGTLPSPVRGGGCFIGSVEMYSVCEYTLRGCICAASCTPLVSGYLYLVRCMPCFIYAILWVSRLYHVRGCSPVYSKCMDTVSVLHCVCAAHLPCVVHALDVCDTYLILTLYHVALPYSVSVSCCVFILSCVCTWGLASSWRLRVGFTVPIFCLPAP